jgi:hypothetical protein
MAPCFQSCIFHFVLVHFRFPYRLREDVLMPQVNTERHNEAMLGQSFNQSVSPILYRSLGHLPRCGAVGANYPGTLRRRTTPLSAVYVVFISSRPAPSVWTAAGCSLHCCVLNTEQVRLVPCIRNSFPRILFSVSTTDTLVSFCAWYVDL